MNLRKAAEGQSCVMCGVSDNTICLHHIRTGHLGIGKKPKDHRGIDLCSKCHTYVHGDGIHDYKAVLIAHLRQIDRWIEAGAFK